MKNTESPKKVGISKGNWKITPLSVEHTFKKMLEENQKLKKTV